jgi:hypothetical protein
VVDLQFFRYKQNFQIIRLIIKEEVAWILSRTRTLDQSIIDNLFTKIQLISPSLVKELKLTSQSDCPQTNGVFH